METITLVLQQEKCKLFEFQEGVRVNGIIDVYYEPFKIQIIKTLVFKTFETKDQQIDYVLKFIKENLKSKIPIKNYKYHVPTIELPKSMSKKNYKISFGKYKGKTLQNVPQNYLLWIVKNLDSVPQAIIDYCNDNYIFNV